jgi:hypothetical protein
MKSEGNLTMAFTSKKNKQNNDNAASISPGVSSELSTVQKNDPDEYAIMTMEKGAVVDMLRENMGDEKLTANDLNRITVPTGGNTSWKIPTIEGNLNRDSIKGVIVLTQSVRAYWEKPFGESGGGSPPDCVARDGLTGVGNPGGDCLTCPMSQWESAKQGKGRGKACSESRLIYLVPKDEILPTIIKVPATSLANARKYLFGLTSARQKVHSVYTSLTLVGDKNADQIEFSKIVFTKTGDVENPSITEDYATKLKPYLTASFEQAASKQDPVS